MATCILYTSTPFSCNFINCCIENNKNDLPTKKKKNVQVTLVSDEEEKEEKIIQHELNK